MTAMFVPEQQEFLGAMTTVTAAGVLRVQSPFLAIPLPAFPGGAGSGLLPLPTLSVNEWRRESRRCRERDCTGWMAVAPDFAAFGQHGNQAETE